MDFAAAAHKDQQRKANAVPYISHCAAVGLILQSAGFPSAVVSAGILHDVLEDTPVTEEQIEKSFGSTVAGLIHGVSEPDKALSWKVRKQNYCTMISEASEETLAIVAADKIHNIHSMLLHDEMGGDLWSISKGSRDELLWYFGTVRTVLHDRFGVSGFGKIIPLIEIFDKALELLEEVR